MKIQDKAETILESLDELIQINWNMKEVYIKAIVNGLKKLEGNNEETKPVGRPKKADSRGIVIMRDNGYTQEETAQEFGYSLSTVRRHWKLTRDEVGLRDYPKIKE